jgi:serine-type D-Ala-D-Ala carboxypeptidase/endopeptidase
MIRRRDFLLGAMATSIVATRVRADFLPDDDIRTILRHRIDNARHSVGMVACSFDSGSQKMVTYGRSGRADDRPLDGDTVFEIGSITKVFTALLLAEMVTSGEVSLDDPVAKYLPGNVKMPERNGKQISLLDLATYRSGLPRIPEGIREDADNPYASYTAEQLYAFLSGHTLKFDPGSHYEYSNLGFALLGHVLALKADTAYEDLLLSRICAPLGLTDTRISLNASMRDRLAQGHFSNLQKVSNWDFLVFAGTGALRSTANDLVKFMNATCLAGPGAPLQPAIELSIKMRQPTSVQNVKAGLGWFFVSSKGGEIIYKEGMTGGYASFAGFSRSLRSGAVLLSNAANPVSDIGFHLSNPASPIAQYPELRIDATVLASYQGTYQMAPGFTFVVRAEDGRLFVRATGRNEYELFPESDNRFFMRLADARGIFLRNKDGTVDRLLWHEGGKYHYCPRVP